MVKLCRTRKNGSKRYNCASIAKIAQNGKTVPQSQKWFKMVKLCRTRKNGSKW